MLNCLTDFSFSFYAHAPSFRSFLESCLFILDVLDVESLAELLLIFLSYYIEEP